MFEEWGLSDLLTGPPYDGRIEFRLNGKSRQFQQDLTGADHAPQARIVPQQVLVMNLLNHVRERGIDVRFAVTDVEISGAETGNPAARYTDADVVRHDISCDYIAGCDDFHGVSRTSMRRRRRASTVLIVGTGVAGGPFSPQSASTLLRSSLLSLSAAQSSAP